MSIEKTSVIGMTPQEYQYHPYEQKQLSEMKTYAMTQIFATLANTQSSESSRQEALLNLLDTYFDLKAQDEELEYRQHKKIGPQDIVTEKRNVVIKQLNEISKQLDIYFKKEFKKNNCNMYSYEGCRKYFVDTIKDHYLYIASIFLFFNTYFTFYDNEQIQNPEKTLNISIPQKDILPLELHDKERTLLFEEVVEDQAIVKVDQAGLKTLFDHGKLTNSQYQKLNILFKDAFQKRTFECDDFCVISNRFATKRGLNSKLLVRIRPSKEQGYSFKGHFENLIFIEKNSICMSFETIYDYKDTTIDKFLYDYMKNCDPYKMYVLTDDEVAEWESGKLSEKTVYDKIMDRDNKKTIDCYNYILNWKEKHSGGQK